MPGAPKPQNEAERLASLRSYKILDTMVEREYDDVVELASYICHTPINLISLVDEDRQWFKSKKGLEAAETSRDLAFCAHAILTPDKPLIVNDTTKDERFADNALVLGGPEIRFYAGCPLNTPDGNSLGTLCVIDTVPRELSEVQINALQVLSSNIVNLLELRRAEIEKQELLDKLQSSNADLERFAFSASHDLTEPLRVMRNYANFLEVDYSAHLDEEGQRFLGKLSSAAERGFVLVEDLLAYSRVNAEEAQEYFDANQVFETILVDLERLVSESNARISHDRLPQLYGAEVRFSRLLQNLIVNSLKYQPEGQQPVIHVGVEDEGHQYILSIKDNGIGIEKEYAESIFEPFKRLHSQKKYSGTGLGLAMCKKMAESMGGRIWVNSEPGKGSIFYFSIPKAKDVEVAI